MTPALGHARLSLTGGACPAVGAHGRHDERADSPAALELAGNAANDLAETIDATAADGDGDLVTPGQPDALAQATPLLALRSPAMSIAGGTGEALLHQPEPR